MAAGELPGPYVAEVFAYELGCMELMSRASSEPGASPEMMVEFHHAPDELLGPLSELKMPPLDLPSGIYRTRVRWQEEQFRVEVIDDVQT